MPRPPPKRGSKPDAARRRKFVAIYLADPERNATEAALRAGFSKTRGSAKTQAMRLMREPAIKEAIAKADQKVVDAYDLTRERIVRELAIIGLANPMDYGRIDDGHFVLDLSKTSRDQMAALSDIESSSETVGEGKKAKTTSQSKIKIRGKREALVDAARMLGYLREEGPPPANVTFNILGLMPEGETYGGRSRPPAQRLEQPKAGASPEFVDPARR